MKMIRLRDPNDETRENMNNFWRIFIQWISTEEIRKNYYSEEYINSTTGRFDSNIEFYDKQYLLYYMKNYPYLEIANHGIDEDKIKDFLEITYSKWIVPEKKDLFSISVNKQLKIAHIDFFLPVDSSLTENNTVDKNLFVQMDVVDDPAIRKELLEDIVMILTLMQGDIIYRNQKENTLNDAVRNGLKITRKYTVHDQSRYGESESGLSAGELDLLVTSKDKDLPISVVEALILDRMDQANLSKHIDKALKKYDPNGCTMTIIIIYSRKDNFAQLASDISDYLKEYKSPHDDSKCSFEELNTGYTESRHWKLELIRSKKNVAVHIFDFNMP